MKLQNSVESQETSKEVVEKQGGRKLEKIVTATCIKSER